MAAVDVVDRIRRTQGAVLVMTKRDSDSTPPHGTNVRPFPGLSEPPEHYSDPVVTPARTPDAKKAKGTWNPPRSLSLRPANRPSSYGMAATLITLAVSSAAGIGNPLHRTLVILLIIVVVYFVGLLTQ